MSTTYSQPRACRNGLFHIHPTTRTCWVALDAGIQSQFLKALPKILPKSLKWTFDLISIDNLFKHLSKKIKIKKNLNQDLLKINSLVFEHEWLWVNFPLTRNFLPTHSPRASSVSRRANGQHVVTHWKSIKTFMCCLARDCRWLWLRGEPLGATPALPIPLHRCHTSWAASRTAQQLNPKSNLKSLVGCVLLFTVSSLVLKGICFVSSLP